MQRRNLLKAEHSLTRDLLAAVSHGDLFVVSRLLDRDEPEMDKMKAFLEASSRSDMQMVRAFLQHPKFDPSGDANIAIRKAPMMPRATSLIQLLLADPRVDPSARNYEAVLFAARLGKTDVITLLMNHPRYRSFEARSQILNNSQYAPQSFAEYLLDTYDDLCPFGTGGLLFERVALLDLGDFVRALLRRWPGPKLPSYVIEVAHRAVFYGKASVVEAMMADGRLPPSTFFTFDSMSHESLQNLYGYGTMQLYVEAIRKNALSFARLLEGADFNYRQLRILLGVMERTKDTHMEGVVLQAFFKGLGVPEHLQQDQEFIQFFKQAIIGRSEKKLRRVAKHYAPLRRAAPQDLPRELLHRILDFVG